MIRQLFAHDGPDLNAQEMYGSWQQKRYHLAILPADFRKEFRRMSPAERSQLVWHSSPGELFLVH